MLTNLLYKPTKVSNRKDTARDSRDLYICFFQTICPGEVQLRCCCGPGIKSLSEDLFLDFVWEMFISTEPDVILQVGLLPSFIRVETAFLVMYISHSTSRLFHFIECDLIKFSTDWQTHKRLVLFDGRLEIRASRTCRWDVVVFW